MQSTYLWFLASTPMSETQLDRVRDVFTRYLKERGQRKTPERYAILSEVYAEVGHFDVETLYSGMKAKNYHVSRATLYNTLDLLVECGLVRRHQFATNQAHYEKSYFNRQHDHLLMVDNGEVIEFCDPRIQQIKASIAELFGVEVTGHQLYIYAKSKNEQ